MGVFYLIFALSLLVKGSLPKLALPEGWIALNHRSGGIVYLHKPSRVCTWSRPYHIGGGSVRVKFSLCFIQHISFESKDRMALFTCSFSEGFVKNLLQVF